MANSTVTRRQFLSLCGLAGIPSAITGSIVQQPELIEPARKISVKFPGQPEFWFGDVIRYPWFSANENKIHWETGEVTGVAWHPKEKQWLYAVNWTTSTSDTNGFNYPIFDEHLTDSGDFQLVTKG
ncbi:hypothetical protein QUA82_09930 [Microcoleus sp. F8-D3]